MKGQTPGTGGRPCPQAGRGAGAPHDGMTGRGAGPLAEGRDTTGAEEKYPCSMRYGLAFPVGKV